MAVAVAVTTRETTATEAVGERSVGSRSGWNRQLGQKQRQEELQQGREEDTYVIAASAV